MTTENSIITTNYISTFLFFYKYIFTIIVIEDLCCNNIIILH